MLRNTYCTQECPIGKKYVPPLEEKSISQITLEMVVALNELMRDRDRLMEITVDGTITQDDEYYFTKEKSDRALSEQFSNYFVNFVRCGDPNSDGLPVWERSATGTELLHLGDTQEMIQDPYLRIDEILDRMQGWED